MEVREAQPSEVRFGLDIVLDGTAPNESSQTWTVAGWRIQFVRLQAHETAPLDQTAGTVYLKVITGALIDPDLGPFAAARTVRSTMVDASQTTAGPEGALFTVLTATEAVPDNLESMDQLAFNGPIADTFVWDTFYDRFRGAEIFKGVDAHIVPGFHLLDADGVEIVYVHFWTMGKGGDASTHNHSHSPSPRAPAFAEVHWVFNNGTGDGAMYECDAPGEPRTRLVMQRGEEHGPFFGIDPTTSMPQLRDNGAVEYGFHGWQGGTDDSPAQAFDFVAAFEINPDYALVTAS